LRICEVRLLDQGVRRIYVERVENVFELLRVLSTFLRRRLAKVSSKPKIALVVQPFSYAVVEVAGVMLVLMALQKVQPNFVIERDW
jgi:hypothetical protein